MTGIKTRGGYAVLRVVSLHPDGTAVVDVGTDGQLWYPGLGLSRVPVCDLCGPSPDWSTNVNRLAHNLRLARSLTRCSCPVARMIAVATVKRAVAGLRELTGRPKKTHTTAEGK